MIDRYYLADDGLEPDAYGAWVTYANFAALAAATRAVIAGIERTQCNCHCDYKRRNMVDPSCVRHALDVSDADLELAKKLSREES